MQICELYVDGSAHPNPGPGGFGVVGLDLKKEISYIYNEQRDYTTNNEMELSAILFAMKNFGVQEGCAWEMQTPKYEVHVYSDSNYAIQTYSSWMFNWANNGWRKSDNSIPKNLDIIKEYYDLYQSGKRIVLHKVKGHNGNKWNEMADKLATGKGVKING